MSTLVSVLTTLFFALGVVSLLLCKQDQSPPTEAAAVATATVFEQLPSVETVTLAPPSLAPAASNSFGARKGQCSAEVLPNKNVLVRISGPPRDSVTLGVHRGGQMLDTKFSTTAEGILINIGFWDTRGAINVTVVSNRRPRVHEVFELDLGSDPIADALDVGRALAHDVAGVVASHTRALMASAEPVALSASAFLAGHLEDARLAAASAAKDLGSSIGSAVSSSLNSAISAAAIGLKKGQAHAKAHAKELLAHGEERIEEYAEDLGIEVLKLRIAARLWYYKMTNRLDSYEDYNRKAKLYIAEKSSSLAAQRVEKVAKMQGPSMPAVQKSQFSWWSKGFCTSPA